GNAGYIQRVAVATPTPAPPHPSLSTVFLAPAVRLGGIGRSRHKHLQSFKILSELPFRSVTMAGYRPTDQRKRGSDHGEAEKDGRCRPGTAEGRPDATTRDRTPGQRPV